MNAKIKWIEDQKMLGESGTGHSVVMDALDSGKGVSPMEMFLLGIGGCTSLDVLSILKKSRQDASCRDFLRMLSTSREVQPPIPRRNISIGLTPLPESRASMTTEWPVPDSPSIFWSSIHLIFAFIIVPLVFLFL